MLHGGSGLTDDDFRNTIAGGIAKVNIFTDLCLAGMRGMQAGIDAGLDYLETRNLKVAEIRKKVVERMQVFGSEGKK